MRSTSFGKLSCRLRARPGAQILADVDVTLVDETWLEQHSRETETLDANSDDVSFWELEGKRHAVANPLVRLSHQYHQHKTLGFPRTSRETHQQRVMCKVLERETSSKWKAQDQHQQKHRLHWFRGGAQKC